MKTAWKDDGSNPTGFLQKLSGFPPFLPDDARIVLSELRTAVQDKVEANEEDWIVSKFQAISEKGRRKRLLTRLQELLFR